MNKQNDIDLMAARPIPPQGHLINGKVVSSLSATVLTCHSPIDGSELTTIAAGDGQDIELAVKSARARFQQGGWRNSAPAERKKIMLRWAELIEQHALELAVLGSRDNGTEINMALKAEPGSAANTIRYYAETADKVYGEIAPTADNRVGLIIPEPIGVVGVIVPWNFPLMITAWKIAPALVTGNSVIIKPAEIASLSILRIAALALEAGMPEGVLNVVTGRGSVVGEALAMHPDVDVIAFTGSGRVGRQLLQSSAQSNLKRVYLELGGKSANILFPDTPDLEQAIDAAVNGIFRNSGQVCVAASRLLIHEDIKHTVIEKLVAKSQQLRIGNPLSLESDVGAISSQIQLQQNLDYVDIAQQEGAKLCAGGSQLLTETGGFYMQPTVFSEVTQNMRLAQEEVFGPVLAVMTFANESEAIELANSTVYGLSSAVWTSNLSRAHRMIRELKAGIVHVNCYGGSDITVPLGGVKESGNGHDKSLHAMSKYVDLKSAWIAI